MALFVEGYILEGRDDGPGTARSKSTQMSGGVRVAGRDVLEQRAATNLMDGRAFLAPCRCRRRNVFLASDTQKNVVYRGKPLLWSTKGHAKHTPAEIKKTMQVRDVILAFGKFRYSSRPPITIFERRDELILQISAVALPQILWGRRFRVNEQKHGDIQVVVSQQLIDVFAYLFLLQSIQTEGFSNSNDDPIIFEGEVYLGNTCLTVAHLAGGVPGLLLIIDLQREHFRVGLIE